MTKTRVVWTTNDWNIVAGYFLDNALNPDEHGFSTNLRNAQQKLLPAEKHRSTNGLEPSVKRRLKEGIAAIKAGHVVVNQLKPVPAVEKAETIRPDQLTTEFLLVELAKRLAKLFEPVVAHFEPVDRAFYPPPAELHHDMPMDRQPRILVCGPRGEQQHELQRSHPKLDLRFVASEDDVVWVTKTGPSCDEIVLWTNYISHQHQVHAKLTGRPIRFVSGGLHAIHERLKQWDYTA